MQRNCAGQLRFLFWPTEKYHEDLWTTAMRVWKLCCWQKKTQSQPDFSPNISSSFDNAPQSACVLNGSHQLYHLKGLKVREKEEATSRRSSEGGWHVLLDLWRIGVRDWFYGTRKALNLCCDMFYITVGGTCCLSGFSDRKWLTIWTVSITDSCWHCDGMVSRISFFACWPCFCCHRTMITIAERDSVTRVLGKKKSKRERKTYILPGRGQPRPQHLLLCHWWVVKETNVSFEVKNLTKDLKTDFSLW